MVPPFKNFPYPVRLLFLIGMFVLMLLIFTYLAIGCVYLFFGVQNIMQVLQGTFTSTADKDAFLFVQGIVSLASFAGTAVLFSYLEASEFSHHLRMNIFPKWKMIALAVFSILVAQFFIDFLVKLNGKIPIPHSLEFLKGMADKSQQVTDSLLDFKSFGRFIWVSVVVALVPAFGEEMFFRGLLLGDMLKAKTPPAIAIVFTGLVFAIFHFEFQNTLAIWALGCFLGYLYYISGSLWLTIAVHFTNNFLEFLLKYLYNNKWIAGDATNTETPLYATLISITVFSICIYIFYKWKQPYEPVEELMPNEEISQ